MVLTLEQERRLKSEKRRRIMSLRMDKRIIPDLIENGIAWFSTEYILNYKWNKKKHETRWVTTNSSNGGTQS